MTNETLDQGDDVVVDDDKSLVETFDGLLNRAEPFFPMIFGLVQISPKEVIEKTFTTFADKVRRFVDSTDNGADNTLIDHIADGMQAAVDRLRS